MTTAYTIGTRVSITYATVNKAAIADEDLALVTSANLTGAAIESNMELGLLVRGGGVPRRLARHFRSLIGSGALIEVDRS